MVRKIVKNEIFLKQKSTKATSNDAKVVLDLIDTLHANKDACVGMAANMIGVKKRIIVVSVGMGVLVMINPVIVKKDNAYEAKEGCLSLTGIRNAVRYETIEVLFEDRNFIKQQQEFSGWTAQIIQHEMDHLEGILI